MGLFNKKLSLEEILKGIEALSEEEKAVLAEKMQEKPTEEPTEEVVEKPVEETPEEPSTEETNEKLYESGVDLVWIDTHANCSERCQPWKGKLYSISGKSGVIDGISYQPLSNATDRCDTTKSGKTYINGTLTGFNCRHTTTPYKKGSKPSHIPADVIERQRAIETKQREMERTIRKYEAETLGWKAMRKTSLSNEDREIANKQYKKSLYLVEKWQEKYKNFSRENNVAYYPSRLKV